MINNINASYPRYACAYEPKQKNKLSQPVAFTGGGVFATGEKGFRKVEFIFRCLLNKITDKIDNNSYIEIYEELQKIKPDSEEFINILLKMANKYSKKMEVEINLEDRNIEKIVASNKPQIFIMNHDKQFRDPNMLATFGKILYNAYKNNGAGATCPRPKIILNEDILNSMNSQKAEILKKLGAIGIDANVLSTDKGKNARAMLPVLRDFIRGKANIFIFPEGRLAGRKPTLKQRFQSGVSEMVNKLVEKVDEVNVTPIAFGYHKFFKKNLTSMFVGKPIIFKQNGEFVTTTKGNIDSEFATKSYKEFFKNTKQGEDKIITDSGIPVKKEDTTDYISGILCENLEICKNEAKKILPDKPLNDSVEFII